MPDPGPSFVMPCPGPPSVRDPGAPIMTEDEPSVTPEPKTPHTADPGHPMMPDSEPSMMADPAPPMSSDSRPSFTPISGLSIAPGHASCLKAPCVNHSQMCGSSRPTSGLNTDCYKVYIYFALWRSVVDH